jgi:argininosuccinate lyase
MTMGEEAPKSSKLWGGRFASDIDDLALAYSESTEADAAMVGDDIWGSEAHALMLAATGIIGEEDAREILRWLEKAREEWEAGRLELRRNLEDVHMNVEWFLREGAGPEMSGRLHTARSRNDQVVTDCRMHLRARLLDVAELTAGLMEATLARAREHVGDVMPGYTHTQHAQPISPGFWLSGHAAALARDIERLRQAYERTNLCPLGACAFAGTSLPTNRRLTAALLGFDGLVEHALDAVQSRDFALEALAALAILAANLSRMAEELVLFSTYEFGMVELDDSMASGSSIMPQKKNPCMAELARARTGRVYGRLMQALTMAKALPGGYNRDLQEDKPPLWEALDSIGETLAVIAAMYRTMRLKAERMAELAGANFAAATELANWLVRRRGLPFREAHAVVGGVVGDLARAGLTFADLGRTRELLAAAGQEVAEAELSELLDPAACMARHQSQGGTGPEQVRAQVARLEAEAAAAKGWAGERREALAAARAMTDAAIAAVLAGRLVAEAGLPEV